MADFFDRMMVGINKGAATITEGGKTLVEKAKINTKIHDLEGEKNKIAQMMGFQAYNLYLSGVTIPDELVNFCMEMQNKDEQLKVQKSQLEALEKPVQPQYVPTYGAQQYAPQPDGISCTACGYVNKSGAIFCANCGNKLAAPAEPATEAYTAPAEPAAEAYTAPAEPAAEAYAAPAEPAAEAYAAPAEPAAEAYTAPAEPAAEAYAAPAAEPVAEAYAAPATEPVTEQITEPATDSIVGQEG